MTITILKNGERIASYYVKPSKKRRALKSLKAFYNAAYAETKAIIEYYVG